MATHRAIPGANLPETGTSSGRKGRNAGEVGEGTTTASSGAGLGSPLPGESGLGSGMGAGLGAGSDAFGTTGASATTGDATSTFGGSLGESGAGSGSSGARQYPRPVGVMDQVKQQASTRVNEQKARAAEGLGSVANAIRQASEHMRTENQTLAAYADRAVDQIQMFADRMRDKDPADMMQDLERFARRNPTAFVGGAFLLGLGLARFLKSSSSQGDMSRDMTHYDSDFGGRDLSASASLSGTTGYTAGDNLARPDDLSRPSGGLMVDPAPGITS